jgi:hypothetical protein
MYSALRVKNEGHSSLSYHYSGATFGSEIIDMVSEIQVNILKLHIMELRKLPHTDAERLQALKVAYQKAVTTPKENLAFSSDMMKYLKPFITKLNNEIECGQNESAASSLRQIIDELLRDIWDEVEYSYSNVDNNQKVRMVTEYGVVYNLTSYNNYEYQYEKVA